MFKRLQRFNSLALETALLVLGGTSLVLALVIGFSYKTSKQIILAESEKNARNLALSVSRRIEEEFRALSKVTENLVYVLETLPSDAETLPKLLQRIVKDNKEVFGAAVAFEPYAFDRSVRSYAPYFFKGPEGVAFGQLGTSIYNYFQQDWYHIPQELGKPCWSQPYFDEGGGDALMITYSCPFYQRTGDVSKGKLKGIATSDISLEWLNELVMSIKVGQSGFCFIVTDLGTFVSHPRRQWMMRESMFSVAEEMSAPMWRTVGRAMRDVPEGFVEFETGPGKQDAFLAHAHIPSTGWALGVVFPADELFSDVVALHNTAVRLAAVGLVLILGVGLAAARSVARPLRRMARAAERIARGDYEINLSDVKSSHEVGQLARALTKMVGGLRERDFIRDTFGRYVTREVVNRLLESKDGLKLGGEAREITLMMSDLRGFTALTTSMPPEKVVAFLNRYLGKMVEILIECRGTIDEIIGDGILAFFGAPEHLDDHPARAVACALMMQLAMDEVNEANQADGLPNLEMGAAVHTGTVVVGNIGSERRSKYGAVGSQVNFTGRMESFSAGGQVLISQATHDRLEQIVEVRNVLKVEMKGVPGKIALYDVKGIGGEFNIHLPERDTSLTPLPERLHVLVQRLEHKAVADSGTEAWITRASHTLAAIELSRPLGLWEDVRMLLTTDDPDHDGGEIYAKIVSISEREGVFEAEVRFTFLSPQAIKMLRRTDVKLHARTSGHSEP